jgi:hypothetical protein
MMRIPMKKEVIKNIQLRVTPELHKCLKVYCVRCNTSIQGLFMEMIEDFFKKGQKKKN